jgi:NAD(P)-dependent dehydrogenase (short-subunit alcohol dehydrogenase family)
VRLASSVCIVTGAASGLGLIYASHLADLGAAVVLADVQDPGPAVEALISSKPTTLYMKIDVGSSRDVEYLARMTKSTFGRIDVLVNNAALYGSIKRKPFEEISVEEWERVLGVNVIGTFLCTAAVVPEMRAQNYGKIINIASNVVHKGLPHLLHYVASKGAVIAMTRALARELGPFGITVNAVAPGYVLHENTTNADNGRNQQVIALRSLPRTESPQDLLGTISFLASRDSDFISGQTIVVDGGEVFV